MSWQFLVSKSCTSFVKLIPFNFRSKLYISLSALLLLYPNASAFIFPILEIRVKQNMDNSNCDRPEMDGIRGVGVSYSDLNVSLW